MGFKNTISISSIHFIHLVVHHIGVSVLRRRKKKCLGKFPAHTQNVFQM